MVGTDSMETMMRMSELQPISQDTINILDRAGSKGNSTMSRPVGVRAPEGGRRGRYNFTKGQHLHKHFCIQSERNIMRVENFDQSFISSDFCDYMAESKRLSKNVQRKAE